MRQGGSLSLRLSSRLPVFELFYSVTFEELETIKRNNSRKKDTTEV